MGNLAETWLHFVKEQSNAESILTTILAKKYAKLGVNLSNKQLDELRSQIKEYLQKRDSSSINENFQVHIEIEAEISEDIELSTIQITASDFRWFKRTYEKAMGASLVEFISDYGDQMLIHWKKFAPVGLKRDEEEANSFNNVLKSRWGKALETFEMLLSVCTEFGMRFNDREHIVPKLEDTYTLDALIRLQARGCQIARETLILLRNGLADGAFARWRTIQEVAVFASFIDSHDSEAARRYLLHSAVDVWREMQLFQMHYKALGYKPIPKRVMNRTDKDIEALVKEFGKNFLGHYGWAAGAIGKQNPSLGDIEEATKQRFWQPFIQMAHAQIHALSGGISHTLGMTPNNDLIIYGASVYGIGEPACFTAYSLGLLTTTLLSRDVDIENYGLIDAIVKLVQEVYQAFNEVDESTF